MKKLLFLSSIVVFLSLSCSKKEDTSGMGETQKASMTISIVGNNQLRAVGNPTQIDENTIYGYRVYVFYNDVLEKITPLITGGGLTQTLQGLTTGVKKVVVVANPSPSMPDFYVGDPYSKFAEASFNVNLDGQSTRTNGLIMTGEANVTLAASPAINAVTIPVSRIVAKIKLGSITLEPVAGINPNLFVLEGVAIMDAPSLSSLGLPNIVTTPPLYGGLDGGLHVDFVRSHLFETISLADHDNRYFYVFADDATMLTLVATYNSVRGYFVFKIDPIRRNTQHTLNITLKRLGSGSPSPDEPSDPTTLDVTIVPEDWEIMPTQYVSW